MALRIGIEVSPGACRIVELDRAGSAAEDETVVRAFAVAPSADEAVLARYRRQHVAVVAWGLPSDHRQTVVTSGMYSRMRREAVKAARQAGVDTRNMLADIARVPAGKERRRPVVIALARMGDVAAAARPFRAAGLRVRSVVTPALALMSLARLRRRLIAPGLAEAYVALEETCAAIALVRDGALIAAREFAWGFHDEHGQLRPRDEVAERLGAAIQEFLDDCGAPPSALAQVCVCGAMPELRSMTIALTARLDVEVEPLDSLFGIDPDRLPSDDFRDRVAGLRLAWAAAADWNAPINFLRERRRRAVKTALTRAAIVGGVATGLGIAWRLGQSAWFEPAKPASKSTARAAAPPPRPRPQPLPVAKAAPPAPTPAPTRASSQTPNPTPAAAPPPQVARTQASPAPSLPPPVQRAPVQPARAQPPSVQPTPVQPPPPVQTRPAPTPPVVARAAPSPSPTIAPPASKPQAPLLSAPPPRAVVLTPVPEPVRPLPPRETLTARPAPAASRRPAAASDELPLPFDATLGTILFGADRKLAIVDGRIVQVGDAVKGARVVEITPNSVLFRDTTGRLRRLSLDQAPR